MDVKADEPATSNVVTENDEKSIKTDNFKFKYIIGY